MLQKDSGTRACLELLGPLQRAMVDTLEAWKGAGRKGEGNNNRSMFLLWPWEGRFVPNSISNTCQQ